MNLKQGRTFQLTNSCFKVISRLYAAITPWKKHSILKFAMKLKKPHSGPIASLPLKLPPKKFCENNLTQFSLQWS